MVLKFYSLKSVDKNLKVSSHLGGHSNFWENPAILKDTPILLHYQLGRAEYNLFLYSFLSWSLIVF